MSVFKWFETDGLISQRWIGPGIKEASWFKSPRCGGLTGKLPVATFPRNMQANSTLRITRRSLRNPTKPALKHNNSRA